MILTVFDKRAVILLGGSSTPATWLQIARLLFHLCATPPLTGSQLLDFGDLAAMASELLGKPFHRTMFDDEELRARMTARGAPASAIGTVLGFFIASGNGEFATVDPTLAIPSLASKERK